ncbi:hypothetical protein AgCh_031663 [Apium graveolens]
MSCGSKFVEEGGSSFSNGSENTFSDLGSLNRTSVPLSSSGGFSSFGVNFGDNSLVKEEVVGDVLKVEGTGDSINVFDSDVGVLVSGNRESYFRSQRPYNARNIYHKVALNLEVLSGYCYFADGYLVYPPSHRDRMWDPSRRGLQAIPDLWFAYGFRLPMYPFFPRVLKTLDYGLGQIFPNLVLQINEVIAHHCELEMEPSLDLFFSLYWLKSTGARIYFDVKPGCPKLVSTPSSDSGWHLKWAWYEGHELAEVALWSRLSPKILKVWSESGSLTATDLARFCGRTSQYTTSSFSDVRFLCNHSLSGPKL